MNSSYYDIDAILATQQKLPCTFKLDIPGLGHLESPDTRDVRQFHRIGSLLIHKIKEGARIDLSYWLAELLAIRYNFERTGVDRD